MRRRLAYSVTCRPNSSSPPVYVWCFLHSSSKWFCDHKEDGVTGGPVHGGDPVSIHTYLEDDQFITSFPRRCAYYHWTSLGGGGGETMTTQAHIGFTVV